MPSDGDRRPFAADVLEEAVAEALEAVERHERRGASEQAAPTPRSEPAQPTPPAAGAAMPAAAPDGPSVPARSVPADAPGEAGVDARTDVEDLRAELARAEERAGAMAQRLAVEHDRLLRAAADLDNQRKRALRDKDDVERHGNERLVKELLPVLDNLERALAAASPDDPLSQGVAMTRRLFEDALARFGVKPFSSKGQPFDPRLHEALMTVATSEVPPGIVLEEQQRGFLMHERLVRAAAVVVSAAPPESPDPAADVSPGAGPDGDGGGAPPGGTGAAS